MLVAACSMTYLCTWRALSAASRCPPRSPPANDNLPRGLRPMGLPELGWVEGRSYLRGASQRSRYTGPALIRVPTAIIPAKTNFT